MTLVPNVTFLKRHQLTRWDSERGGTSHGALQGEQNGMRPE